LNFILDALDIILKRNVFYFNDKFYQQIKGTAMGTKVAPTYATLVLGFLEETLYEKITITKGLGLSSFIETNFLRF
jgi:hypothetical protein